MNGKLAPLFLLITITFTFQAGLTSAAMPYSAMIDPTDPYAWSEYLFINSSDDLPSNFDHDDSWWLSNHRDSDPLLKYNPQEFYGVRGMGANRAWEVTTGRPDVVIAIIDSGMMWNSDEECFLLRKFFLNRGELPLPAAVANPEDSRFDGYDSNGDGVFNIEDYWSDPAVSDINGNGWVDPEDLILIFSDGVDDDNNGYIDDISGWDFFENDNDPQDDVEHSHGSHQAGHAAAEAGLPDQLCPGSGTDFPRPVGTCPNCMILPLRVSDSFIAEVNHYAEAVVYAVDNGARVIENALGTLNHTSFGQAAVNYAYGQGVIVNASSADEAAGHHNWPASYEHTVVHNSIRPPRANTTSPESYLFLNGCTNFGAYTHVTIPSESCSSQATGLASGISGLLISAALNAVERGSMTSYLEDDGSPADYPLSPAEIEQLWRLAGDDIDFSTDYPEHAFSDIWSEYRPWWWLDDDPDGTENNYGIDVLLIPSRRYQTVRGWDYFTGYGRINAARLVRFIGLEGTDSDREYVAGGGPYSVGHDPLLTAQDRIPPEADITWPRRWHQYGYSNSENYQLLLPDDPSNPAEVVVQGRVAANRVCALGGSFDYVLEWAPGAQGEPAPAGLALAAADSQETSAGPWTEVARVSGLTSALVGELGRIPVADLAAAISANPYPFRDEGDPTSPSGSEQSAVRLRLRVIAHPANGNDLVNNEAVQQKQIDVYLANELVLRDDLGVAGSHAGGSGSPSFHDLDGDGRDELLLPSDDGLVHAYTDVVLGHELPGWPVSTRALASLPTTGDNAYTRGEMASIVPSSLMFGTPAVGDLDDDGSLEVVIADCEGRVYAWLADGSLADGFPVTVDYNLSAETPCGPATIPDCDDRDPVDRRNQMNRRDWAILAAPALGDLDPGYPGLEILVAVADSHIYAWHSDGSPVAGWPVILRDPDRVETMDPAIRTYTYRTDSQWLAGSKATTTPSLGDIDGDGDLEVVVNVNEEYNELPNADFTGTLFGALLALADKSGNGRSYALHHTGAATPETAASLASSHTHDQAYLPGWPVAIAMAAASLLPTAGQGSNTQPVLADIDGDGTQEIVTASHFGPGYVLDHDGDSFLGHDGPFYRVLDHQENVFGDYSQATDGPSLPALGGIAIGSLAGDGRLTIAAGSSGIKRMLDNLLPARQTGAEDHLGLWNGADGHYEDNAPLEVNDLQFFVAPIIADITGDGQAEVIQQSALGDLVAVGPGDDQDTLIRYPTGGWAISSPAVGRAPLGSHDQGTLSLASVTREGFLRLYPTTTPDHGDSAGRALSEWPEAGHDAHNSGNYEHDGERPGPISDLEAFGTILKFTATGDDRAWGRADHYELRQVSGLVAEPEWQAGTEVYFTPHTPAMAGTRDTLELSGLVPGSYTLMLRAYDEAGNGSPLAVVALTYTGFRQGSGRTSPP